MMIVARMANHSAAISIIAALGLWLPKNSQDQRAFRISCNANRANGMAALLSPASRHTSQAETAMVIYRIAHTGPKSQFGGVHDGLARFLYQLSMFGVVAIEPIPAVMKHITRNITNAMT
jgi:hypothetical protein